MYVYSGSLREKEDFDDIWEQAIDRYKADVIPAVDRDVEAFGFYMVQILFAPMRQNVGSTMPYEERIFDNVVNYLQKYAKGILFSSLNDDCRDKAYDMLCKL